MIGPLPYIGGKRAIADRIIAIFPKHTAYVEPFAGGAQVFFHKAPSKVEVLNDLDGEMVNFFRVCQQHYEELLRYSRFLIDIFVVAQHRPWHRIGALGQGNRGDAAAVRGTRRILSRPLAKS